jgi:SAM-dependent methyltransferase
MSVRNVDSIAPWTARWKFESAAGQSKRPELDLLIEPVWHEFIDGLPEGARILDLATGNGAVAISCAQRARSRRVQLYIDAVDAAEINPPVRSSNPDGLLPQLRFKGGVWLEDLPFKNDEFDAVVSQFGFEYADEEPAVSEATRVLSPDGRLRLVIHARGGAVWKDIDYRYQRLNAVLAENGAVSLVRELAQALRRKDAAGFNRKQKHLAAAVRNAKKLAHQAPPDDSALFYCREFLYVWSHRKKYRLNDLLRSVEDGWTHANGTAERYAQLLRVARTEEEIAALCDRFKTAGLANCSLKPVCNPTTGAQIAWQVDAGQMEMI